MRYHVRRRSRSLRKKGAKYVSFTDPEEIHKGLDTFFELHTKHWNKRKQRGNFIDSRVRSFHRSFVKKAAQKGWIRLTFIQIENDLIASLYGYEYQSIFWYYQAGMNPEYYLFSPGVVLFWNNIHQSINQGCS